MNRLTKQIAVVTVGCALGALAVQQGPRFLLSKKNMYETSVRTSQSTNQSTMQEDVRVKRQKYLDALLEGIAIPFCERVVYDHDGSALSNYYNSAIASISATNSYTPQPIKQALLIGFGVNSASTPDILELSGKTNSTEIFIHPRFFEDLDRGLYGSNEARNIIVAHEGHHAYQHAHGLSYFPPERMLGGLNEGKLLPAIVYGVMEVDAEGHALRRIINGEFGVSANYSNKAIADYMKGYNALMRASASGKLTALETELIIGMKLDLERYPELHNLEVPEEFYKRKEKR